METKTFLVAGIEYRETTSIVLVKESEFDDKDSRSKIFNGMKGKITPPIILITQRQDGNWKYKSSIGYTIPDTIEKILSDIDPDIQDWHSTDIPWQLLLLSL